VSDEKKCNYNNACCKVIGRGFSWPILTSWSINSHGKTEEAQEQRLNYVINLRQRGEGDNF
jgi:hypothetical protein